MTLTYLRKTKKENILGAFVILLLMSFFTGNAQVGIGTSSPNPAAALEITSTSQGLLPPRMKASERNAIINPPAGLVIWCSDCGDNGELQVFNGLTFTNIVGDESSVTPRTQLGSILGGNNDCFGSAVGLSSDGSIVAVGAPRNDGNGYDAGHVRVYEFNSGSWTQLGNDIDGEATYDQFGKAVSLSANGSLVAVGAPRNDGNGSDAGHVSVYEFNSGSWTQLGNDIDGEATNDWFGKAVSLSANGSILAAGASGNDGNGTEAGHVRVYEYNSGSWTQLGRDDNGVDQYNRYGISLNISSDGTKLVIGAVGYNGIGSARVITDLKTTGL